MSENTTPASINPTSTAGDHFLRCIALLMFALVAASITGFTQLMFGGSAEYWPTVLGGVFVVGAVVLAVSAYIDGTSRLR